MIAFSHPDLETKLVLSDSRPTLLIVENPRQYYKIVTDLMDAFDGKTSDFTCWDGQLRVRCDKVGQLLTNAFSFDLADKRMVSLLHKTLQTNYQRGSFIVELNNIARQVDAFLSDLSATVDFAIESNDLVLEDLLKVCGVKPAKTYQSFLEKIVCYVNMFVELNGSFVFAFVGLKDVLDDDDLQKLYDHCKLSKVCLLLLESCKKRLLLSDEQAVIITDDLCEILENFPEEE